MPFSELSRFQVKEKRLPISPTRWPTLTFIQSGEDVSKLPVGTRKVVFKLSELGRFLS
jgi:hypothetical protein